MIDLLDEQGFKPLENFKKRNPGVNLTSTRVTLPSVKTGKTPPDYISCVNESFKQIKKDSSYYRRILLIQKPRGRITYKSKMKKRFGVTLKHDYVNRVTTMLNSGMIPPGNSDILHMSKLASIAR